MDFKTTVPALLTQPATLSAEPDSEKASAFFKLVAAVALLVLVYLVFLH